MSSTDGVARVRERRVAASVLGVPHGDRVLEHSHLDACAVRAALAALAPAIAGQVREIIPHLLSQALGDHRQQPPRADRTGVP